MNPRSRLPTAFFILFFGGLLAAFLTWKFGRPADHLRTLIQREILKRWKHDAKIGELRPRLTGLVMSNVQLANGPDFTAGILLSLDQIQLAWPMSSLWRDRSWPHELFIRSAHMVLNWPTGYEIILTDMNVHVVDRGLDRIIGSAIARQLTTKAYQGNDFHLEWDLTGMSGAVALLSGTALIHQGMGKAEHLPELLGLKQPLQVQTQFPDLSHLRIDEITGPLEIMRGKLRIKALHAYGPDMTLDAEGTIDLSNLGLDIEGRLSTLRNGQNEGSNAKIHVGGSINRPAIQLESLKQKAFRAKISL